MRRVLLLAGTLAAVAFACSHERASSTGSTRRASSVSCTVPNVENARPVELVALPPGCSFDTVATESAPQVLHDAAELASALRCEGTRPPSIDLASRDVYVLRYSMSPAFAGRETLDDGTTVTFVTRFRQNCPDDPLPMPMNVTYGFLLPEGATRTFREASCTLPRDCP